MHCEWIQLEPCFHPDVWRRKSHEMIDVHYSSRQTCAMHCLRTSNGIASNMHWALQLQAEHYRAEASSSKPNLSDHLASESQANCSVSPDQNQAGRAQP